MLANFCLSSRKTNIDASCLTIDGCEVENLMKDPRSRMWNSPYFMAEPYIKCPVEVVLTFPCLIDISAIVIEPRTTYQRTRALEIYSAYQKPLEDSHKGRKEQSSNVAADVSCTLNYPCKYEHDFTLSSTRTKNRRILNFAGKYNERGLSKTPEKLVFVNKSHPISFDQDTALGATFLDLRMNPSLRSCSNLVIIITWATVPVLRSLQVWATASKSNKSEIYHYVQSVMTWPADETLSEVKEDDEVVILDEESQTPHCTAVASAEDKFDISEVPEEFIDPITFQLMAVPMLLPSGNSIDRSTLDRFINEESKYGRLPSDPFTSMVFRENHQPIPNTSLKSRIDKYVLQNAARIQATARSAGFKGHVGNQKSVDRIKKFASKRKRDIELDKSKKSRESSRYKGDNGHVAIGQSSNLVTKHKADEIDIGSVDYDKMETCRASPLLEAPLLIQRKNSHETELKQSLDMSLMQTLSVLPISGKINHGAHCFNCNNDQVGQLLKLPCNDLFCRQCVSNLLSNQRACSNCNRTFSRGEVTKVH